MTARAFFEGRELGSSSFSFRVVEASQQVPEWRLRPFSVSVRGAARSTVFPDGDDISIFISAINNTDAEITPDAEMTVLDAEGEQIAQEIRRIRIARRSAAHFPFSLKVPENGTYHFEVRFLQGTRELGKGAFEFRVGPE